MKTNYFITCNQVVAYSEFKVFVVDESTGSIIVYSHKGFEKALGHEKRIMADKAQFIYALAKAHTSVLINALT